MMKDKSVFYISAIFLSLIVLFGIIAPKALETATRKYTVFYHRLFWLVLFNRCYHFFNRLHLFIYHSDGTYQIRKSR